MFRLIFFSVLFFWRLLRLASPNPAQVFSSLSFSASLLWIAPHTDSPAFFFSLFLVPPSIRSILFSSILAHSSLHFVMLLASSPPFQIFFSGCSPFFNESVFARLFSETVECIHAVNCIAYPLPSYPSFQTVSSPLNAALWFNRFMEISSMYLHPLKLTLERFFRAHLLLR